MNINFLINGEETPVTAISEVPLSWALEDVLKYTSNGGRPLDDWECRDATGVLLEVGRSPSVLGLTDNVRLFLSVRVGAGGEEKAIHVANWQPVRDSLQYAYKELGLQMPVTPHGSMYPIVHWNIAVKMHDYNLRNLGHCLSCKTELNFYTVIRCLDCKAMLCEHCAGHHFGANHQARAYVAHAPGDLLGPGQRSE